MGDAYRNSKSSLLQDHSCWGSDSDSLAILNKSLAGLGNATEDSYLALGSKIRWFHGRAREISKVAGEVLQLLQGDDGENTLQHLQLLVERCSLWLITTDEKSTAVGTRLNTVVTLITGLYEPVVGLRKVIKILHSLRVSTRIEATKGYTSGAGVLAKSLDELSRMIHEKIIAISDRTDGLVPKINESLTMEETVQSGAIRIASHEVRKARRLLSDFLETRIETGQWTDRLKERSDDVAQSFGEIVSALQFQDITCQRLDHVQKAIAGLGLHLEKFSQRSDFSRDDEASRIFGRICRLQYDQLHLAGQEFLSAADKLSVNLGNMTESVITMAEDTRELLRATNVGCESRFSAVLEVLKLIVTYLEKACHVHQDAGTHLTDVCVGIQEVSGLVEDIERIGEEIQLLAMNATINAAHASQQGAGLEIIAQSIHDVAEEATGYAQALSRECATITNHAVHLQDIERDAQSSTGNAGTLLSEAQKRIAAIEANSLRLMGLAVEIDQDVDKLAEDVNKVVKRADLQRDFQEKLTPALDHLERLAASADEEVSACDGVNLEVLLADLEHCYTMDSERRVHRRFIAKDKPLSSFAMAVEDEWSSSRNHGLGDNVDLF